MSIEDSTLKTNENTNDEVLEFPLRLSKICLLNIRDDNAFISPFAIEEALHALAFPLKQSIDYSHGKLPLYFHNYFILDQESIDTLPERWKKNVHTEFQIHKLTDIEQRKNLVNDLLKDFSQQVSVPLTPSQKSLGQVLIEPMTLVACSSFVFRPFQCEDWDQLWSLKFHPNTHLSIEAEFYFTKGFFRVAFRDTFYKIEIPGEIFHGIQMKLIILLPRCSSDLVHLYANIKEYLDLPYSFAYIGVCIPKIYMDIDMNLFESLKMSNNLPKLSEQIHLSGAHSFGHFSIDFTPTKSRQSSSSCLHCVDLSPTTPWIFFANRPFLFFLTYDQQYIFIGQMLGPKIRHERKKYFSKHLNY